MTGPLHVATTFDVIAVSVAVVLLLWSILPAISYKRVGGIRFISIGRLGLQVHIKRKVVTKNDFEPIFGGYD